MGLFKINHKNFHYYKKAIARLHIAIIRKTCIKGPLDYSEKANRYWILEQGKAHHLKATPSIP